MRYRSSSFSSLIFITYRSSAGGFGKRVEWMVVASLSTASSISLWADPSAILVSKDKSVDSIGRVIDPCKEPTVFIEASEDKGGIKSSSCRSNIVGYFRAPVAFNEDMFEKLLHGFEFSEKLTRFGSSDELARLRPLSRLRRLRFSEFPVELRVSGKLGLVASAGSVLTTRVSSFSSWNERACFEDGQGKQPQLWFIVARTVSDQNGTTFVLLEKAEKLHRYGFPRKRSSSMYLDRGGCATILTDFSVFESF